MSPNIEYQDDDFTADEFDDDPEAPQASDLDDDDDEETATEPCPNCDQQIAEFAEQCPYCGEWITHAAPAASRRGLAYVIVVVLVIAAFLIWLL